MDTTSLFFHSTDPYPRLKAWRSFQKMLNGAEARLFRFILILMRVRQFMDLGESADEFDEMVAGLKDNLVSADTAQHVRWLSVQSEALAVLTAFRRRQKGEVIVVRKPMIARLNTIIRKKGVDAWTDRNFKPFMKRLNARQAASSRAVGLARVRCYRCEIKAGAGVLVSAVYKHDYIRLTVRRVRGDRTLLSDGSHAVFRVRPGTKFSQPYGQWTIVDGQYKGRDIRAEMPLDEAYLAAQLGLVTPDLKIQEITASRVIDPTFEAKRADDIRVRDMAAGGTMTLDHVGESVLPGAQCGTLATYLIRRFGYPTHGTDSYKELMGAWRITTPEPGLIIQISALGSPEGYGLWYGLTPAASREVKAASDLWWRGLRTRSGKDADKAVAVIARYYRAARVALADLMRPVEARDRWITAEGFFNTDRGEFNDDGLLGGVARDLTCNYGVDRRTLENFDAHGDLMDIVSKLGPDFATGLARAAKILQKRVK